MDELQQPLTDFEMLEPGYRAIQKLELRTIEDLLRTPARTFMQAAGFFEPIQELKQLLGNMGIATAGTPFGELVAQEERPPALSGPVRIFQNGEPVFSVDF